MACDIRGVVNGFHEATLSCNASLKQRLRMYHRRSNVSTLWGRVLRKIRQDAVQRRSEEISTHLLRIEHLLDP